MIAFLEETERGLLLIVCRAYAGHTRCAGCSTAICSDLPASDSLSICWMAVLLQ